MEYPDYVANALYNAACIEVSVAEEKLTPHYLYRPKLYRDGNRWCALYGDDLVVGVSAFGQSPDEAYREFDKAWYEKIDT